MAGLVPAIHDCSALWLVDARAKRGHDGDGRLGFTLLLLHNLSGRLGINAENKDMTKDASQTTKSPSQLIDARIKELGDWRGKMLGRLRALIREADPDVVEEWKWRGVPVWEHDG